jgi:hypothetical protein
VEHLKVLPLWVGSWKYYTIPQYLDEDKRSSLFCLGIIDEEENVLNYIGSNQLLSNRHKPFISSTTAIERINSVETSISEG